MLSCARSLARFAAGKESQGHGYERATAALLAACLHSSLVVAAVALDRRLGALGSNPQLGPAQPGRGSAAGARKPAEGSDIHGESSLGGQNLGVGWGAGGQQVPSPRPSLLRPAAPRAGAVLILAAFPLAGAAPASSRAVPAPGRARHQPQPRRWRAWPRAAAPSLGSARGSRGGC